MKRKVLALVACVALLLAAVGVVWAVWQANSTIHTSLQIGVKPAANITVGSTNDDEVVANPNWDAGDTGLDPSGPGPLASRFTGDSGTCTTTIGPGASEASLNIIGAYGGYFCDGVWKIGNPAGGATWTMTAVTLNGSASLANCPTMTSADLNADTQPDVEACVSQLDDAGTVANLLPVGFGSGVTHNARLSLHVLDTATGGATRVFDVVFVGAAQN